MSKTLKTYPDGSELTVNNMVGAVATGIAVTTAFIWIQEWRRSRRLGIKMWH